MIICIQNIPTSRTTTKGASGVRAPGAELGRGDVTITLLGAPTKTIFNDHYFFFIKRF